MRILLVFTFLASGISAFSQNQFTTTQDPQIYFVYNAVPKNSAVMLALGWV